MTFEAWLARNRPNNGMVASREELEFYRQLYEQQNAMELGRRDGLDAQRWAQENKPARPSVPNPTPTNEFDAASLKRILSSDLGMGNANRQPSKSYADAKLNGDMAGMEFWQQQGNRERGLISSMDAENQAKTDKGKAEAAKRDERGRARLKEIAQEQLASDELKRQRSIEDQESIRAVGERYEAAEMAKKLEKERLEQKEADERDKWLADQQAKEDREQAKRDKADQKADDARKKQQEEEDRKRNQQKEDEASKRQDEQDKADKRAAEEKAKRKNTSFEDWLWSAYQLRVHQLSSDERAQYYALYLAWIENG